MSIQIEQEVESICQRALGLHQESRLGEAELLFQQALQLQPRHFQALHLLGIIAAQTERPERAVEWLQQAVLCNPQSAAAHNNRGNVLCRLNRYEEALVSFER